ncbi:hypothetical protein LO762_31405 [Actinocorallia sp. API 0066]|uniref:hypothetical protein n=1 Tax=Actinocorallia sp. API 0066 TaxID=2896846 RepID=UPI001E6196E9|nr:hypothetical protein [Actinocorallia sp. API 0066]MCD0453659.1 hypothetical protein [Actinocorallia sp. API 0066]
MTARLLTPARPAAPAVPAGPALTAKIIVAGGPGTDRRAFVRAVADAPGVPLAYPRHCALSSPTRDPSCWETARVTLAPSLVVDLYATPEPLPAADSPLLAEALGAVILFDTRRPRRHTPALDFFEDHGLAHLVALTHTHHPARPALPLYDAVPTTPCVPSDPSSARTTLLALLQANVVATTP